MVKTRSQTGNIAIKKEEEEDCKPSLSLGSIRNTRASARIAKRRPSIIDNRPVSAQQVKLEEHTDTKSLLQAPSKSSRIPKGQHISQEQINQLIHYIVKDHMRIREASRKVNISERSGSIYYKLYKDDPEKKIPLERAQDLQTTSYYTQKHVENLIRYISQDKMSITQAAAKADMPSSSGKYYYKKYLKDPNHAIPVPRSNQYYTQDQRDKLISYIVNDKMSILAASKKARVSATTGRDYYHNYFEVQNPDVARPSHIVSPKCYAQEQIKEVISYIVDDKMTIKAASKKANINPSTVGKCYRQYVIDNNMGIPALPTGHCCTQDQINDLIRYIVDDKMTLTEASKKANMSAPTGIKYYRKYRNDHHLGSPIQNDITQEQKSELIRYIVDDKMSIVAASKKVNTSVSTGIKCYRKYLKDHHIGVPIQNIITQKQKSELIRYIVDDKMSIVAASKKVNVCYKSGYRLYHAYCKDQKSDVSLLKRAVQDQVNELIGYVVNDKMSVKAASKKANLAYSTGHRHYHRYLNDQKHDVPTRRPRVVSARKNE